jgi:uncharacterized Tic20 family protein
VSTCHACTSEVPADAHFCPQCATPVASEPTQPLGAEPSPTPATPAPTAHTGLSQQNWAVLAHLSALAPLIVGLPLTFLGPLVLWLLIRDRGAYVRHQATEALNFNISWFVWGVVLLLAGLALSVPTLGLAMFPALMLLAALAIAWLTLVIVAAVRAAGGETYRYPLTMRFVAD